MEERELIGRVIDGDPVAERAMYDAHVDRVFRLAYRMTGEKQMAEDFTQETFIRAFDRLPGFRGEAALSTWLHSIAVSIVLNGLRKMKNRQLRETVLNEEITGGIPVPPREHDLARVISGLVDKLSDKLRLVFVMHDVEGYKHREIADLLGQPTGTVKANLSRARGELRAGLIRAGVAAPQERG